MIRVLAGLVLLLVAVLGWSLLRAESHKGAAVAAGQALEAAELRAAGLAAALADVRGVLASERAAAETMSTIGSVHEDDRRDAESVPAAVAADLRAGNLRLRKELAGCATDRVSLAAGAAVERDAAAAVREQIAGDLVRIGRDADNHVRACQAVIQATRAAALEAQP